MNTLRILIVDDEAHARDRLSRLLEQDATVEVVGKCTSGAEAVSAVGSLRPDLMLLDVQMPELDGFGVVRAIPPDELPLVVFVTAFDEHAVQAFDIHAVDYVLKPVEASRLFAAIARARKRVRQDAQQIQQVVAEASSTPDEAPSAAERFVVRHDGQMYPIRAREIVYVEAEGNYARLHLVDKSYMVRETMTNMEKRLDGSQFARIHRSVIVNLDAIREMQPWFGGDYVVILKNGTRLKASRMFKNRLDKWMLG